MLHVDAPRIVPDAGVNARARINRGANCSANFNTRFNQRKISGFHFITRANQGATCETDA
jgi:hypothetical protein